jgi:hypothetical protein
MSVGIIRDGGATHTALCHRTTSERDRRIVDETPGVITARSRTMPRYEVIYISAAGTGTDVVEARGPKEARRIAKANCAFSGVRIAGVRKVGDTKKQVE